MVATQEPTGDPLLNPPEWYVLAAQTDAVRMYKHPLVRVDGAAAQIFFGEINGHLANFYRWGDKGECTLLWGCREIPSENAARLHWPNNVSVLSGVTRPHAIRLIDWCHDICAYHKWSW